MSGRADAALWERVKRRLRTELGEDVFSSWFARVEFEDSDGVTVNLSVPTRFLKSWIQSHYLEKLVSLWTSEMESIRRVELIVRGAVRARAPVKVEKPVLVEEAPQIAPTLLPTASAPIQAVARTEADGAGSPVDPRFTFETFCEGTANRVAYAAARAVAETPAGRPTPYNPLYIHAGVGRGKTHLLHAVAQAARQADPSRKVVYLTAEHFMFRFVAALKNQSAIAFKEGLREIDLLLIDDLQFLQGKSVQQEFCHMLNALIDGARQVVVAADRPAADLETLDERVRSRLRGGVAFEIGAPDLDLRRQILKSRYVAAQVQNNGVDVPDTVIEYVAQSVVSNGRDLEGALNRLVAQWQFTNQPVTMASAEITLRDLVGAREPRRVKIEDIQKIVAIHYNVSKADLLSSRRTRTIVRPRQIAMYLSKTLTPRSLPEIGRRFGGRDHTTVLHAVRKVEELMQGDKHLAEEVELLKRMIDE
ncbi:chromosomal replication initiator protein DnaA [Kaistia dalseonensis]|uniref:Chromosomal replication initiator protein DnaA n=1 Tax=Kaistia dalseonensis TaxID=410840 RepID=A0ABU0H5H1_9HYPH|nr:chromosomal replication initiator protein DnaA [Kaistia dalseonensis]MCX5494977.1 chromosomal replication initiator protein DnaA [Kaistia dalseonensis]MDQ0437558.1 chromosomal replication initiator protein [Kaistia dalseonensis]